MQAFTLARLTMLLPLLLLLGSLSFLVLLLLLLCLQMYLRQFTCVGLWRSEVLSVKLNTVPYAYRDPTGAMSDTVTVTVGDAWQGGAATELTFPYQAG